MRFKIRDEVIVKAQSERPGSWNSDGLMDDYMGKICTVTSIYNSDEYQLNGDGWIFNKTELMPVPRIGDKVKIRSWEDMERQYGMTEGTGIVNIRRGGACCSMYETVLRECNLSGGDQT